MYYYASPILWSETTLPLERKKEHTHTHTRMPFACLRPSCPRRGTVAKTHIQWCRHIHTHTGKIYSLGPVPGLSQEMEGRGRLYLSIRCHHQNDACVNLRSAGMRSVLMFEGQSHNAVPTEHNCWRERSAEAGSHGVKRTVRSIKRRSRHWPLLLLQILLKIWIKAHRDRMDC